MKARVWIEGSIIIALSCLSLAEALRLIIFRDPTVLYDPLGPGWYVFIVGCCALLSGIAYLLVTSQQPQDSGERAGPINYRLGATIALSFLYAGSIYVFGYYVSTLGFLVLEFRVLGVNSWAASICLSIVTSAALWLLFIYYAGIIFPAGIVSLTWW